MRLAARLEDAAPSAGLLPLLLHLLRFVGLREPCPIDAAARPQSPTQEDAEAGAPLPPDAAGADLHRIYRFAAFLIDFFVS